jgi:hypothetical protein
MVLPSRADFVAAGSPLAHPPVRRRSRGDLQAHARHLRSNRSRRRRRGRGRRGRRDRLRGRNADRGRGKCCNRVRVTCTGTPYMCLGQEDAHDLRGPLRASESDELLHAALTHGRRRPAAATRSISRARPATRPTSVTPPESGTRSTARTEPSTSTARRPRSSAAPTRSISAPAQAVSRVSVTRVRPPTSSKGAAGAVDLHGATAKSTSNGGTFVFTMPAIGRDANRRPSLSCYDRRRCPMARFDRD